MGLLDFFSSPTPPAPAAPMAPPGGMLMGAGSEVQEGEMTTPALVYDTDASKVVGSSGRTADVLGNRLLVDAVITADPTAYNRFGSGATVTGVPSAINDPIPVPPGQSFYIKELKCWGNKEAEYFIYADAAQIAGGRSSAAEPTLQLTFAHAIRVDGGALGKVITISALQYSGAVQTLKSNISGVLI